MGDVQEGFDLLARNEFAAARDVFEQALALSPDDADALFGLARSWDCNCDFDRFMHLTDLNRSRDLYEQLLARDEWDLEALYYLCRVLIELGDSDEALKRVEQGLDIDPAHPDLLSTLGMLLYDQGNFDDAESVQKKALYHSGASAFLNELALVNRARGRDGEAESILRLTLEIDPEASWAWRNLAQLLADRKNWSEAISCGRQYFATGGMEIDMEDLIKDWDGKRREEA